MVQWLREFAALAEVQGLVTSTHRKAHVNIYLQIPGIQHPLLTYEVTKDGAQMHIKQT